MNKQHTTHVTVTNARGDAVFHDDKRIPGVMADALLIAAAPERAAVELRRQQHEIERLNDALKWEQDRSEHLGTHGQGCHTWGPRHYECLLREYKSLLVALETLLEQQDDNLRVHCSGAEHEQR